MTVPPPTARASISTYTRSFTAAVMDATMISLLLREDAAVRCGRFDAGEELLVEDHPALHELVGADSRLVVRVGLVGVVEAVPFDVHQARAGAAVPAEDEGRPDSDTGGRGGRGYLRQAEAGDRD